MTKQKHFGIFVESYCKWRLREDFCTSKGRNVAAEEYFFLAAISPKFRQIFFTQANRFRVCRGGDSQDGALGEVLVSKMAALGKPFV
jgi:hypothetical protein